MEERGQVWSPGAPGQSEPRMLGTEPREEHRGSRQRRETRAHAGSGTLWWRRGFVDPRRSPRSLTLLCASVFGVHLNKWQLDRKLGCGVPFPIRRAPVLLHHDGVQRVHLCEPAHVRDHWTHAHAWAAPSPLCAHKRAPESASLRGP